MRTRHSGDNGTTTRAAQSLFSNRKRADEVIECCCNCRPQILSVTLVIVLVKMEVKVVLPILAGAHGHVVHEFHKVA